jgi:hypothetical protein
MPAPDHSSRLSATHLTFNPPLALPDYAVAEWAEIISQMPADRITTANVPIIVAAARLMACPSIGHPQPAALPAARLTACPSIGHPEPAALPALLHFLGVTPAGCGEVASSLYAIPSEVATT